MENLILWLSDNVPNYVWQICLFLLPANPVLQFLFGKLGYVRQGQAFALQPN